MALLDFLGQDIGGYHQVPIGDEYSSAGSYDIQGKGKTGITWGDLLSHYSNSAGMSQSAPLGSLTPAQFPGAVKSPQTVPIMNISNQLPMQEEKQQGQSDWQSIAKIIMSMFGSSAAGGASAAGATGGASAGVPIT